MPNESLLINRISDQTPTHAHCASRREILVKAGTSFLVIMVGGFASYASTVRQGEIATSSNSPEMANTNEPMPSEHKPESAASEDDSFWYVRDIYGLID